MNIESELLNSAPCRSVVPVGRSGSCWCCRQPHRFQPIGVLDGVNLLCSSAWRYTAAPPAPPVWELRRIPYYPTPQGLLDINVPSFGSMLRAVYFILAATLALVRADDYQDWECPGMPCFIVRETTHRVPVRHCNSQPCRTLDPPPAPAPLPLSTQG